MPSPNADDSEDYPDNDVFVNKLNGKKKSCVYDPEANFVSKSKVTGSTAPTGENSVPISNRDREAIITANERIVSITKEDKEVLLKSKQATSITKNKKSFGLLNNKGIEGERRTQTQGTDPDSSTDSIEEVFVQKTFQPEKNLNIVEKIAKSRREIQSLNQEDQKKKGFTALLCNTQRQDYTHELIETMASKFNAGILFYCEPSWKKIEGKEVYPSEDNGSAVRISRHLQGSPLNWTAETFFTKFEWNEITFINCYLSPNISIQEFESQILRLELEISSVNGPIILVGDMNSRHSNWGDILTTRRGKLLAEFIEGNNLIVHNNHRKFTPTFVNHLGQSVIDLVLSSPDISDLIKVKVLDTYLPCDHKCLRIDFDSRNKETNLPPPAGWYLNKSKFSEFATVCKEKVSEKENLTPEDCHEIITETCDRLFTRKDAIEKKEPVYWWNENIGRLRRLCQKLRRKLQRSRKKRRELTGNERKKIKKMNDELRGFKSELIKEIQTSKKKGWKKLISELDRDPWGTAYKIIRRRLKNPKSHCECSLSNMEMTKVLEGLFPDHGDVTWTRTMIESQDVPMVTEDELRTAAHKIRLGKAPGPDNIPPILARMFIEANLKPCVKMLNANFINGSFPKCWKSGRLALIPKFSDDINVKKYRPIVMLSVLGKIFEHIIASRILSHTGFSPNQYGFVKGRSTVDAMRKLQQIYDLHMKDPQHRIKLLAIVGLDIKNAFNSLRWTDVIEALHDRHIPQYLIEIMKSYLSDRSVIANECVFDVNSGAAQGSVLGPLLWNLVFDKLVRERPDLNFRKIAYADDMLAIFRCIDVDTLKLKTQRKTKEFKEELGKKSLNLELNKVDAVILRSTKKVAKKAVIVVDEKEIKPAHSMRYLGFHLTKNLDMSHHINEVCNKAINVSRSYRCLMPNLHGPSFLKKSLIVSAIMSIIFYGISVWYKDAFKKKNLKKITSCLRPLKRSMVCGYSTVSNVAIDILSGIPPTELLLEKKFRRNKKTEDFGEIDSSIKIKWKEMWAKENNTWIKKLIPYRNFDKWINRNFGLPNFYTSQFFSGHGAFGAYFYRFKIHYTPTCPFCNDTDDTPEHTFFKCSRFIRERRELEIILNAPFEVNTIVEIMIENKENWKLIEKYIREVLIVKRQVFKNCHPTNPEVMTTVGPGVSSNVNNK